MELCSRTFVVLFARLKVMYVLVLLFYNIDDFDDGECGMLNTP
jgi:hypothetical protein